MSLYATSTDIMNDAGSSLDSLYYCAIVFLPITYMVLGLRIYSRVFVVRGFGWDDIFLIMAQAFFTVFAVITIQILQEMKDPAIIENMMAGTPAAWDAIEKIYVRGLLFNMFFTFSVILLKISLAVFFLRIIVRRWQRCIIYLFTAVTTLYGITSAFIQTFRCGPDPTHPLMDAMQGKCLSDQTILVITLVFQGTDVASDLVFAIMPTIVLWSAHMPRGVKFTACLLLSMGSVSCICAIIRLVTIAQLRFDAHFAHKAMEIGLWSIIEPGLALIAISLAACRPLWRKIYESEPVSWFFETTFGFTTSKGSGGPCAERSGGRGLSTTGTTRFGGGRNTKGSRPCGSGLSFSNRCEGFTKFEDSEYGISMTTVTAGNSAMDVELAITDKEREREGFRGGACGVAERTACWTLDTLRSLESNQGSYGWIGRSRSERRSGSGGYDGFEKVALTGSDHAGKIYKKQDVSVNVSEQGERVSL